MINKESIKNITAYYKRKFVDPFLSFLKKGVTPKQLALSVTLGIILGVLPILGVTTIVCAIIAITFRLNMVAIQLANQLVYPIQLFLFIPFIKAGEAFFNDTESLITINGVVTMFQENWYNAIQQLWFINFLGVVIWLIVSVPTFFALYYISKNGFKKFNLSAA